MPTYSYICNKCQYTEDIYLLMSERNILRKCPKCSNILIREIGSGSGFIFKGTGFYETDYKNK